MCMRRFIQKLRHAVKYLLVGAMVSVCLVIVLYRSSSKYRGSYMSAHVLLNLLNGLRKRDKMRGLPSILSLFSQRV